jgi:AraC-like DNA-binding protein
MGGQCWPWQNWLLGVPFWLNTRLNMKYALLPPPPALRHLVKCFWTIESSPATVNPKQYYLMADGCPEILFQFKGGFTAFAQQKAQVRAQHACSRSLAMEPEFGFFGVRFYPFAIQQLLGMPASEVSDQILDFNDLFKQSGRDLCEKLLEEETAEERARLVSGFLQALVQDKVLDPLYQLVNQLDCFDGQVDLTQLRHPSGLSIKQFERRFKAITGFAPKQFARIVRFQSTKRRYITHSYASLTKLAYDCHYYDQAHFSREFKEFSGVSASHYFAYIDKGDAESKVIKELILGKERPVFARAG